MTADAAVLTEVAAMIYRLHDTLEVLDRAVCNGDSLTARYAAATVTELGDRIETALLTTDRAGRVLRAVITTGGNDAR